MRISDWSSDVCSSDLWRRHDHAGRRIGMGSGGRARQLGTARPDRRYRRHGAARTNTGAQAEIGRASCKERVCQYVSIAVEAVSLKTQNIIAVSSDRVTQVKYVHGELLSKIRYD